MKIGILAYRQKPYISANTAIAYIVGEEISKTNNEVIYIGRKQDAGQTDGEEYHGIKIRYLNTDPLTDTSRIQNILINQQMMSIAYRKDIHSLKKIVSEEKLDALLCMQAPNDDAYIAMSANLKIPLYLYQLDPFYNLQDKVNVKLKRLFMKYLGRLSYIFTTDLLMKAYQEDKDINKYISKISVVQFPKLISPKVSVSACGNIINLLYAGNLYGDRKASYLETLNSILPDNCQIVFCGKCEDDQETERLRTKGIVCKGYVDQEQLESEKNSANILINIGNSVKNQMPSKIIDYIATGKPIINIILNWDCPTTFVLKDYRYHININVNEIIKQRSAIASFISDNAFSIIPWVEIKEKYYEYTPAYVTNELISKMCIKK